LVNYDSIELTASYTKATVKTNWFVPVTSNSTLLFAANAGYQQSDNLVENQLFRIGGLGSFRGFDQQSILASSFGIATIEYRFLFDELSRIAVFYDLGWYENKTLTNFITDVPMGFGAGISFATNAGIFNMSYALGASQQQELDFRSGKIHFGFINIF
jgi:hemolysin activation/secretion protein